MARQDIALTVRTSNLLTVPVVVPTPKKNAGSKEGMGEILQLQLELLQRFEEDRVIGKRSTSFGQKAAAPIIAARLTRASACQLS